MATKIDKLFALKALEEKVSDERKLVEFECRDELLEAYAADGTDRRTSTFFGPDAGKFSIKRYKAKPGKERVDYALADDVLFSEWLESNADAAISYAKRHAAEMGEEHFGMTGELPDGISRTVSVEPGKPEVITAQVYRFNPDAVVEKLGGNLLEGTNRLLLEGGE